MNCVCKPANKLDKLFLKLIGVQCRCKCGQCKWWTADYGLRTGYKIRTRYKTRTGKYGLGIKHGLGIKRGLQTAPGNKIRTTDYFGKNGANWF